MQIQREEINKQANPFLALECQKQDLAPLVLGVADSHNDVVRALRGDKCHTKQDFFDEIAAAFQFPPYFGENWDAFEECINDLEWLPAESYLTIIMDADQLLSMELPKEFEILMSILERAAKNWKSGHNNANLMRATKGEAGEPKKIDFRIVFQYSSNTDLTGNLGSWLTNANIPKVNLGNN